MSNFIYDAESTVVLKADGEAAVTATTTETGVDFNWDAANGFAVGLTVSAVETGAADETYVFSIVSQDEAGANPVDQITLPSITATGQYRILVDGETAAKIDADAAKIAIKATLGGIAPSITYSAVVNPAYGVNAAM